MTFLHFTDIQDIDGKLLLLCHQTERGSAPFATSYKVGRVDNRTNNRTVLLVLKKNNATAGYQGPVKIELWKDAGSLNGTLHSDTDEGLVSQRSLSLPPPPPTP